MDIRYQEVFKQAPLGLFLINTEHTIFAWNQWLSDKTGIPADVAISSNLYDLFEIKQNPRFDWALQECIKNRSQQVMSYVLNRHLIPIKVTYAGQHGLDFMPQQVYIAPVSSDDGVLAMVSIIDVTENVIRSTTLTDMAHKLEKDSNLDQLTQAYNRRYLWYFLEQKKSEANKSNIQMTFLLLDIDYFKIINDKYGHDVGDNVLKKFTEVIRSILRKNDILVRYGGEEFLIILLGADEEKSHQLGELIRTNIKKTEFPPMAPGKVTCSIGLTVVGLVNDTFEPNKFLKQADKALYHAKEHGRDQVTLYGSDIE